MGLGTTIMFDNLWVVGCGFNYFAEHNVKKAALDLVLRYVSRIEALIHDNVTMTLADSTQAYNCRFESTEINPDQESGVYVVQWEYKCQHTGNIS